MPSDPDNPGNVNVIEWDILAEPLRHPRAAGVFGILPLIQLGHAAKLAMVIKRWWQDTPGKDDGWEDEWQAEDLNDAGEIARFFQASSATTPEQMKARFTLRYLPQDWNSFFIRVAEIEQENGIDHVMTGADLFRWEPPAPDVAAGVSASDPQTWPEIPGTVEAFTDVPAGPPPGPHSGYIRVRRMEVIWPTGNAAVSDFENEGIYPTLNTLPLPPAEHRACLSWIERINVSIPGFVSPVTRFISN